MSMWDKWGWPIKRLVKISMMPLCIYPHGLKYKKRVIMAVNGENYPII